MTCATMTESTPAAMALRNGASSTEFRRARSPVTWATLRCESVAVSPWPGKCLAVVIIPPARAPWMYAATRSPTCSGSSPKERVLIMGFAGLELTSASGKKFQCTPMARDSSAVMRPKASAYSVFPGRAEGHGVRERGGAMKAHGDSALKIGSEEQRQFGILLQTVEQFGSLIGLVAIEKWRLPAHRHGE